MRLQHGVALRYHNVQESIGYERNLPQKSYCPDAPLPSIQLPTTNCYLPIAICHLPI